MCQLAKYDVSQSVKRDVIIIEEVIVMKDMLTAEDRVPEKVDRVGRVAHPSCSRPN